MVMETELVVTPWGWGPTSQYYRGDGDQNRGNSMGPETPVAIVLHHGTDYIFYNFQGIQAHTDVMATCGHR